MTSSASKVSNSKFFVFLIIWRHKLSSYKEKRHENRTFQKHFASNLLIKSKSASYSLQLPIQI
jgi:hypothetical protein